MAPVPISSTLVREVAATGDRAAVAPLVPGAIVDDVLALYGPDA
jgi:phosphopantetheine adenylyltransferase